MTTPNTFSHSKTTAFLVHQDVLYFTSSTQHPVGCLIEGIWTQFSDQARAITRNRIYTRLPLTSLCDGMLKVAGKRASLVAVEEFVQTLGKMLFKDKIEIKIEVSSTVSAINLPTTPLTHDEALMVAKQLAAHSKLEIGAVLLDTEQKIVSYGWNEHFPNKIMHAEVMLVKNYCAREQKKIPVGYTLISTLQPCAMCAGYLHEFCEDFSSLKIIYEKTDPGPFAQNSILIPGSSLWSKAYA